MNKERPEIILFSASPRRRELMERIGIPFRVMAVEADEAIPDDMAATDVVKTIARRKLDAGISMAAESGLNPIFWGLAADTLVEGPEGLLGKPADEHEAAEMIHSLSGLPHYVHSGYTVCAPSGSGSDTIKSGVHTTIVRFRHLSDIEVNDYVATGEWKGAAGAYRIQEKGELLVEKIEGLWSTVVGLPLGPLCGILSELSYPSG